MGDALRDNYMCVDIANPYEHREGDCVTCLKKRLRAVEHELADVKKELWASTRTIAACHKCHSPHTDSNRLSVTTMCEACKHG